MTVLRSYAPIFVKRLVWNWKHRNASVDLSGCPRSLLACMPAGDFSLLDLGCGSGSLRAALRFRGWGGHFIGVDVSATAIEAARKPIDEQAEWHVSAIEDFPIPDKKIDIVCLCESIYYVRLALVAGLLKRCRQCLVPGGRIVIRIRHADRHREYVTLLSDLGAQINPPIYTLSDDSP